jgi:hypothetical protein
VPKDHQGFYGVAFAGNGFAEIRTLKVSAKKAGELAPRRSEDGWLSGPIRPRTTPTRSAAARAGLRREINSQAG